MMNDGDSQVMFTKWLVVDLSNHIIISFQKM